jgi:mRNA interferase MazF
MEQKEIWLAHLNPARGKEQQGLRPVVIISGNTMNKYFGLSIILPISSKVKSFAGCVVLDKNSSNGLKVKSEILTFQIRTIAQERLVKKIGEIDDNTLVLLKQNLIEVLHY